MNLNYKQLTISECIKIICNNNYCHISCCINNKPYLIPMNYEIINHSSNELYLQIISIKNCKKMNILANNNLINICVEETCNDSVLSVICYGFVCNVEEVNNYVVKINVKVEHMTGRLISKNI